MSATRGGDLSGFREGVEAIHSDVEISLVEMTWGLFVTNVEIERQAVKLASNVSSPSRPGERETEVRRVSKRIDGVLPIDERFGRPLSEHGPPGELLDRNRS